MILGGVGPMSGILFHHEVIKHDHGTIDQDHISVVHMSFPSKIEDRSGYLAHSEGKENPGSQMARVYEDAHVF